jgi:hypothetical protein
MPQNYFDLLAYFFGGAFTTNAIPHLVSGLMGRKFPSPFAKPPGKGQSSAMTNALWGFANLVVGALLIARIGDFDLHNIEDVSAAALGVLLMSVMLARTFGRLNDGRGPNLA